MRTSLRIAGAAAVAALPLALLPTAAQADHANGSYTARLDQLNDSGGSGMFSMTVEGDQATVNLSYSGLAETFDGGPYPHVQHIHIGGQGVCPTASDDANGDGIVNTPEGAGSYGAVGTTLSSSGSTGADQATNVEVAATGGSGDYSRTFTMNEDTLDALAAGTGVVVMHGLDPSGLSKQVQNAESPLDPSLPQAATAPALCGAMSAMPSGGVSTGTGSTAGVDDLGLIGLGGGLALAGMATYVVRRRTAAPDTAAA